MATLTARNLTLTPFRFGFLFLMLLVSACAPEAERFEAPDDTVVIPFRNDGSLAFVRESDTLAVIHIEIAETDSARMRGLMQRSELPERSGMLFIFPFAEPQSFWMANTPLSLDLIFVGPDSTIVDIAKYAKPFSQENVSTDAPSRFVVEVPAGFADTNGLIESDRIRVRRSSR